jgi:hypothetical protein
MHVCDGWTSEWDRRPIAYPMVPFRAHATVESNKVAGWDFSGAHIGRRTSQGVEKISALSESASGSTHDFELIPGQRFPCES